MALSAFDDKSHVPQENELEATLGETYILWNEMKRLIAARFPPLSIDWGFAGKSTGWGLRLKQEKRTVLYMTPCKGYFLVSFALGEKAVQAAKASDLPAATMQVIENAPKYAEGRGVRFAIRSTEDVGMMERIATIKMAN